MDRSYALVPPYEGGEPYIFISYSHRDADRVFPLLRTLADRGFRFWYDEGIDPGSEWPESIARHLEGCAVCLAMLSENSLASTNCRREVNFAVSRNKPFLSVVLEPVKMSPGMELQISSYQSLLKYKYPSEEVFLARLTELELLQLCRELPPEPAPEPEPEPPKTEPKPRERARTQKREKPAGSGGKRKNRKLLPLILAVILAAAVLTLLLTRPRTVTLGGKVYRDGSSVTLRDLTLTRKDVEALTGLKSLRYLYVINCAFDPGAGEKLGGLTALKTLELTDCSGLSTLGFLSSLPELYHLSLRGCGVTDALWSTARPQDKLNYLDLGDNALTAVTLPQGITSLNLEDNRLTSADCLRELRKLQTLDLSGTGLTALTGLEDLTKLKTLDLGGNAIGDLGPLEALVYLESLDLSGNPFSDTAPLGNTSRLTKADLSFCTRLGRDDLDFLTRSAGTLRWLNLSGIGFQDGDFLRDCTGLTALLVQGCGLSDLDFLRGMTKLETLNAEDNRVADLSPLSGCVQLEVLDLYGNRLTGLSGLPAAPEAGEGSKGKDLVLLLGNNPLEDLSGLDPNYYYRLLDLRDTAAGSAAPPDLRGWNLTLSALPDRDPAELKGFLRVYVTEKDLSRQVAWESALGGSLVWAAEEDLLTLLGDLSLYDRLWPWYDDEK